MRKVIGILIVALLILGGCSKYDDGPAMSLYSPGLRLVGNWYFINVMYGDVDSTTAYQTQRIRFTAFESKKSGVVEWSNYATTQDDYFLKMGLWNFIPDTDSLKMVLYADNTLRDSIVMNWKIKRLAYQEVYLERTLKNSTLMKWALNKSLW